MLIARARVNWLPTTETASRTELEAWSRPAPRSASTRAHCSFRRCQAAGGNRNSSCPPEAGLQNGNSVPAAPFLRQCGSARDHGWSSTRPRRVAPARAPRTTRQSFGHASWCRKEPRRVETPAGPLARMLSLNGTTSPRPQSDRPAARFVFLRSPVSQAAPFLAGRQRSLPPRRETKVSHFSFPSLGKIHRAAS